MNADFQDFKHTELTDTIIKIFYEVYNSLGYGFLEKVYENAMKIELEKRGIPSACQSPINVYYKKTLVGEYCADF